MDQRIPLPTLLSYALVAFTIEFDNELERRMPHRTTRSPKGTGILGSPWLISMAMWFNCLRFVDDGITVGELERRALTKTNIDGMRRWRYIHIKPSPHDSRPKPPLRDWLITPTPAGRTARELGRALLSEIEERWTIRLGPEKLVRLRDALTAIVDGFETELPDCMPILGYGLANMSPVELRHSSGASSGLPLPSLLSKVLLAFAYQFERDSKVSLSICTNVLRLVGEEGVSVRRLPRLACVSKESIAMVVGYLTRHGYAVVEPPQTTPRDKALKLTPSGYTALNAYRLLVYEIENRWNEELGIERVSELRCCLKELVLTPSAASPLFQGLEPCPECWRAKMPKPEGLPHFPMVLHRGGYPDGS